MGMPLMPTGDGSTLVTVLELLDAPCDARDVRVKCVGRALAPAGCRPMGGSSRMVPLTDSTLELYDIMACADYDAVCESLHASCCRLQAKLQRAVGSGERRAATTTAPGGFDPGLPPAHPLFVESLPTIIARQCAALDYREATLGQGAALGQDAEAALGLGPRTHPGLTHPGFLAAALRPPQGTALAPLDALWSPVLTRTSRGLGTVRTGYVYLLLARCAYRRYRAAGAPTVRTPYASPPRACRTFRVAWHIGRAVRTASRGATG